MTLSGTKVYLWIEKRHLWFIGKWQFIKANRDNYDRMRCLILI